MQYCNVIIYSYHYLLDPKIAERVSKELSRDCIVVFDEAHNIDNVCIESLSTDITEDSLRKATRGAHNLERRVAELKDTDQEKLRGEYDKLVEGLRGTDESRREDAFMSNPGTCARLYDPPSPVVNTKGQSFPTTYYRKLCQGISEGRSTLLLS